MGYLIYGLLFALGVYALLQWYANTPYQNVKRAVGGLLISGMAFTVILLIIMVVRGNIGYIPLIIAGGFLFRRIAKQMRNEEEAYKSYQDGGMTRAEALEVLDLKDDATETEIKSAYRRLMQKNHPDKGGSRYLAAKLNEAKRVLLDN